MVAPRPPLPFVKLPKGSQHIVTWRAPLDPLHPQEDVLGTDPSTFFTFDFFMHDTQATPVVASSKPEFNTLVQVRVGVCG